MGDVMVSGLEFMREAFKGVRFTFSANYCSGIIYRLGPRYRCQCWRCREARGLKVTPTTERRAAALSERSRAAGRGIV